LEEKCLIWGKFWQN